MFPKKDALQTCCLYFKGAAFSVTIKSSFFLSSSPQVTLSTATAIMLFFAFGHIFYISILLINAIAVLSEDRFLARSMSAIASFSLYE
jgi:hypothetical protein